MPWFSESSAIVAGPLPAFRARSNMEVTAYLPFVDILMAFSTCRCRLVLRPTAQAINRGSFLGRSQTERERLSYNLPSH